MKKVELHPASVWDCDDCGRENFVRLMRPESLEDKEATIEAIMEMHDVLRFEAERAAEHGEFVISPKTVRCVYCGSTFDATFTAEEDESDEI